MTTIFFRNQIRYNINLNVGEKLKIKMFDQYKNLFFFEGVCVKKVRLADTFSIEVYNKTRGARLSLILNSPLIIGIFKKV